MEKDLKNDIIDALEDNKCRCVNLKIVGTADLGGKFNCIKCGKLQTGVSSVGHGVICYDCVSKGYCKWCGKKK